MRSQYHPRHLRPTGMDQFFFEFMFCFLGNFGKRYGWQSIEDRFPIWGTLFVGPLISLFCTSGDVSSWVSKLTLFVLGRGVHVIHSLRYTSGVTSADHTPFAVSPPRSGGLRFKRRAWGLAGLNGKKRVV